MIHGTNITFNCGKGFKNCRLADLLSGMFMGIYIAGSPIRLHLSSKQQKSNTGTRTKKEALTCSRACVKRKTKDKEKGPHLFTRLRKKVHLLGGEVEVAHDPKPELIQRPASLPWMSYEQVPLQHGNIKLALVCEEKVDGSHWAHSCVKPNLQSADAQTESKDLDSSVINAHAVGGLTLIRSLATPSRGHGQG